MGTVAGAAGSIRGRLLQLVALLFVTAEALDRNMNRSSVLFFLHHSAKECCSFLQGYLPNHKETPYPVPLHLVQYPVIDSIMVLQEAGRSPELWTEETLQHPHSFFLHRLKKSF